MVNYYTILEINNFASADDIKAAYRRLSKRWHPDLNNGSAYHTEKFKELQEAYGCLSKPATREVYDYRLHNHLNHLHSSTAAHTDYAYQSSATEAHVYEKEKGTWLNGRMLFRLLYLSFIVFRLATCDSYHPYETVPVTFEYDTATSPEQLSAQQWLDSIARANREQANQDTQYHRLTESGLSADIYADTSH